MASNLQKYLQMTFQSRKKKNPRYSLRGFARDLQMDATALSRILEGSRPIGPKTAKKILSRLPIDPATRETLLRSLITPEDHGIMLDSDYVELTSQQMEQMDDWIYSAALELTRARGLSIDSAALAGYFGVSIAEAERRVKTLLALGLLKKTEKGLKAIHNRATAPFLRDSPALKKIHSSYIAKSIDALTDHPEESRDISGITVLISSRKLSEASRKIKEFRRSLAHFLGSEDGDELYRLNIQLFPLKAAKK